MARLGGNGVEKRRHAHARETEGVAERSSTAGEKSKRYKKRNKNTGGEKEDPGHLLKQERHLGEGQSKKKERKTYQTGLLGTTKPRDVAIRPSKKVDFKND